MIWWRWRAQRILFVFGITVGVCVRKIGSISNQSSIESLNLHRDHSATLFTHDALTNLHSLNKLIQGLHVLLLGLCEPSRDGRLSCCTSRHGQGGICTRNPNNNPFISTNHETHNIDRSRKACPSISVTYQLQQRLRSSLVRLACRLMPHQQAQSSWSSIRWGCARGFESGEAPPHSHWRRRKPRD